MIDSRLQTFLAKSFMDQHGSKVSSSIFNNPRAMARFLKEANRCKGILSANQNVMASMENVVDGIDFKVSVSRKELETISADLFEKTTGPIKSVLKLSNVSLDDVKSLVLVGGGVRVPAIQKKLKDFVDEQKIARNVDGDEAAVLGAVLHAAKISAQFRLGQTMIIKDLNSKPIQIVYETENSKKLSTGLFTDKSFLGSKKLMTFKRISDFEFHAEYKTDKIIRIATYKVTGLTEGMKKWGEAAVEEPKVKIQIGLTDSGLLQVSDAVALFEIRPDPQPKGDSFKDSVLKMFKKSDDSKEQEKEDKSSDDSKHNETKVETSNDEEKDSKKKTEKSPKKVCVGSNYRMRNQPPKLSLKRFHLKSKSSTKRLSH
jgi:hypoxia up-regulated 1